MEDLQALVGQWVTCIRVSNYPEALTKGKKYQVLSVKADSDLIRIKGDNSRHRWYSTFSFDLSGADAILLQEVHLDDPIHNPNSDCIEVTLKFSDGSLRWCLCATPTHFLHYIENGIQPKPKEQDGLEWTVFQFLGHNLKTKSGMDFMSFNIPHLVMFSYLSEDTIWTTMKHLDDQGELEASSVPYKNTSVQEDSE